MMIAKIVINHEFNEERKYDFMLEIMNYCGCGNCQLSKDGCDCKRYDRDVQIMFNGDQKWDCWGKFVTAFKKGSVVNGYAVIKDNKVYCASATSPIFEFDDFISLDNVEIILR